MSMLDFSPKTQSRAQSPQAFWPAIGRLEDLWDNGISYPTNGEIEINFCP